MNSAIIKPAWYPITIALMVLGFIIFWPLGMAVLAYILWSEYMGGSREKAESWIASQKGSFKSRRCGPRHYRASATGNAAFDEYRDEQLKRLDQRREAAISHGWLPLPVVTRDGVVAEARDLGPAAAAVAVEVAAAAAGVVRVAAEAAGLDAVPAAELLLGRPEGVVRRPVGRRVEHVHVVHGAHRRLVEDDAAGERLDAWLR